jgi:tetratricopeptide (TPR) repeat protein
MGVFVKLINSARNSIRLLSSTKSSFCPEHHEVAFSMNKVALTCLHRGRLTEAKSLFLQFIAILEKTVGSEPIEIITALNNLAYLRQSQHRNKEAFDRYQRALPMMDKTLGPKHSNVAVTIVNLDQLQATEHHSAKAEVLFRRALDIQEKSLGTDQPVVAGTLSAYAILLREMKRRPEAAPLNARAKSTLAQHRVERAANQTVHVRELESSASLMPE